MPSKTLGQIVAELPQVHVMEADAHSAYRDLLDLMGQLQQPGVVLVMHRPVGSAESWLKSARKQLRRYAPVPPKHLRWSSMVDPGGDEKLFVFLRSAYEGRQSSWGNGGSEVARGQG